MRPRRLNVRKPLPGARRSPGAATRSLSTRRTRSQTGDSAREMKEVLGSRAQEAAGDAEDWEDGLNAVVESRGPQLNLSFFAFTATPKGKTI